MMLIASGDLNLSSPTSVGTTFISRVGEDAAKILQDLVTAAAAQGAQRVSDVVQTAMAQFATVAQGKISQVLDSVLKGGISGAWADLMKAYDRGVDVKSKKR